MPTRAKVSRDCPASQGISSVGPSPKRCSSAARNPASKRPGTSADCTGPYAWRTPPDSTSIIGSSQYKPREPLRTTVTVSPRLAASAAIASATPSEPMDSAIVSHGTKTLRAPSGIPGAAAADTPGVSAASIPGVELNDTSGAALTGTLGLAAAEPPRLATADTPRPSSGAPWPSSAPPGVASADPSRPSSTSASSRSGVTRPYTESSIMTAGEQAQLPRQ